MYLFSQIFILFSNTIIYLFPDVSSSDHVASNGQVISENFKEFEMFWEKSVGSKVKVKSSHLIGEIDKRVR